MKVSFNEEELTQVKIFKATDPPNAPNISHEEYLKIQQEVASNPYKFKVEDIRKKEINMDTNQPKKAEISWRQPLKLIIENQCERGKNSKEKIQIENKCSNILSITYFNDIPEPKEGDCKLFAFGDENIPKVENSHIATQTNDTTIEDIFKYIESLSEITKENVKEITEKLEGIENITPELKNKIINQLETPKEENINNNNTNNSNNNNNINNNNSNNTNNNNNNNTIPLNLPNIITRVNPINLNPLKNPFQIPPNIPNINPSFNNHYADTKMFMESVHRMNLSKYKTKACRNYHSSVGCTRGENCFFIHDPNYIGVEIPNFDSRNYEKKFPNYIHLGMPINPILTPGNFYQSNKINNNTNNIINNNNNNPNINNNINPNTNNIINPNTNNNVNKSNQNNEEGELGEIIPNNNNNNNNIKPNMNQNNNNNILYRNMNLQNMMLPQTLMMNRNPMNNMMMGIFRPGLNMGNNLMGMNLGMNPLINLNPASINPNNLNNFNNPNNLQ